MTYESPVWDIEANRDSTKLHKCYYVWTSLLKSAIIITHTLSDQNVPLVTIMSLFYVLRILVWLHTKHKSLAMAEAYLSATFDQNISDFFLIYAFIGGC